MRETLLSTRIFDVERRIQQGADGERMVREIVVHPGAVVVLPWLDERRIVMIHNFRQAVDAELLELPAGTLEDGEEAADAAMRELEEETGYVAKRMEPLIEFYSSPGICTELMRVFVARNLTEGAQRLEAGEQIRTEIVDVERARRAMVDGTIRDGKTIAALGAWFATAGGSQ